MLFSSQQIMEMEMLEAVKMQHQVEEASTLLASLPSSLQDLMQSVLSPTIIITETTTTIIGKKTLNKM